MTTRTLRFLGPAAVAFAIGAMALPAAAQAWPDKPIKFLVPAPAGSSLDALARVIGDRLKDRLGQPVIDFGNLIKRETDTWAPVIRKLGLKVD